VTKEERDSCHSPERKMSKKKAAGGHKAKREEERTFKEL